MVKLEVINWLAVIINWLPPPENLKDTGKSQRHCARSILPAFEFDAEEPLVLHHAAPPRGIISRTSCCPLRSVIFRGIPALGAAGGRDDEVQTADVFPTGVVKNAFVCYAMFDPGSTGCTKGFLTWNSCAVGRSRSFPLRAVLPGATTETARHTEPRSAMNLAEPCPRCSSAKVQLVFKGMSKPQHDQGRSL